MIVYPTWERSTTIQIYSFNKGIIMAINLIKGNIWNTKCQTLVNTVNCEGIMGAGIALEARLRYPDMYENYRKVCNDRLLKIGSLLLYKKSEPYWILNFPTKDKWRLPSKEIYIKDGLKKFIGTYESRGIQSVAFPILGGQNGGLNENRVIEIMYYYLENLPINIEIYQYDPRANDDMFLEFRKLLLESDISILAKETKIKKNSLEILINEISRNNNLFQIGQLIQIKGIGDTTLEKVFKYQRSLIYNQQTSLF